MRTLHRLAILALLTVASGSYGCRHKTPHDMTDDMTVVVTVDAESQRLRDDLGKVNKERDELAARHSVLLQDYLDGNRDRRVLREREDSILSRQQELTQQEKKISESIRALAEKRSETLIDEAKTAGANSQVRQILEQIKQDLDRREKAVEERELRASQSNHDAAGAEQAQALKQILARLDALDASVKALSGKAGSPERGIDYRGVNYSKGDVRLLVDSISSQLADRGLLWSDVVGGEDSRKKADDLVAKGQNAKAMQLLADVQDSVGRITIDMKFLRAKFDRLAKLRGKRAASGAEEKLFTQFAQEQAKGDLTAANQTVNKLYRLAQ